MRRLTALAIIALVAVAMFTISSPANGWDNYPTTTTADDRDPCDEYHESRHPECQTTTTVEVTTTTEGTTTTVAETTTTTAAPCADDLIHQPPLCVEPTTTTVAPTTTVASTSTTQLEELPFTGIDEPWIIAWAAFGLILVGVGLLTAYRQR